MDAAGEGAGLPRSEATRLCAELSLLRRELDELGELRWSHAALLKELAARAGAASAVPQGSAWLPFSPPGRQAGVEPPRPASPQGHGASERARATAGEARGVQVGARAAEDLPELQEVMQKAQELFSESTGAGCASSVANWHIEEWLGPNVNKVVAEALRAPLKDAHKSIPELCFVRALGGSGRRMEIIGLLLQEVAPRIIEEVSRYTLELHSSVAATGEELNAKFVSDEDTFELNYGKSTDFFNGLEALIGSPRCNIRSAMQQEHLCQVDSRETWTTGNYGITTTPGIEWHFVVDPEGYVRSKQDFEWPRESKNAHHPRKPIPFERFRTTFESINAQLDQLKEPMLGDDEWIAARLYTGPMFEKYNAVNRGGAINKMAQSRQSEKMKDHFQELCKGNRYCTTIHAISSAFIKLSKIERACALYRGTVKGVLPSCFWQTNEVGVKGGVEYGFLSTTKKREVAHQYAKGEGGASMLLKIRTGMIDRGADLSLFSQYPHEEEICFPPLTCLEVLRTGVEGSVLVVEMGLNVNLLALTLEKVVSKRHKVVADMCQGLKLEALSHLEAPRWKQLVHDSPEGERVKEAAQSILEQKLERITKQPPEKFNNDTFLMGEMKKALQVSEDVKWQRIKVLHEIADRLEGGGVEAASKLVRSMGQHLADFEHRLDSAHVQRKVLGKHQIAPGSPNSHVLHVLRLKDCDGELTVNETHEIHGKPKGYKLVRVNGKEGAPETLLEEITGSSKAGSSTTTTQVRMDFHRSLTHEEVQTSALNILQGQDRVQAVVSLGRLLALNPNMRALIFSQGLTADACCALAHAIRDNETIESLFFDGGFNRHAARHLADALASNMTLKVLRVKSGLDQEGGMAIVRALRQNRHLQELRMRHSDLQERGGKEVGHLVAENLSRNLLQIENNSFGSAGAEEIMRALRANKTITALHIDNNGLDSDIGPAIADCLRVNSQLRTLWLSDNRFGPSGARAICGALEGDIVLQSLSLDANHLGEEGGFAIAAALRGNRSLQTLFLQKNMLGPAAGAEIAEALASNRTLLKLKLGGNCLEAATGCKIWQAMSKNRVLEHLGLERNNMQGQAVGQQMAKALEDNDSLQTVSMDGNDLGRDAGVAIARGLEKNNTLTFLSLNDNRLGGDVGNALARALVTNEAMHKLGVLRNGFQDKVKNVLQRVWDSRGELQIEDQGVARHSTT